MIAHQYVIRFKQGLTLGRIDDERVCTGGQLRVGREACAARTDNCRCLNTAL